MLSLYHCADARSFRPLWALEELGLSYELHMLPFPPRVREKSYLEVNPLGTIPTLFDGAMRMTESAAICEYLAARFGPGTLGVTVDEPGYGPYLNALHYGEATLTFPQTLVLRYTRLEPEARRVPQVVEDYSNWFAGRLKGLDALLSKSDFVAADRFTAADISVAYALLLATTLRLEARFSPAIADYWQRMQDRDGFKRAKAAQQSAAEAQNVAAKWG
jgi:glutathione S-transferase